MKTATQTMLDRQFKIDERSATVNAKDKAKTSFRTHVAVSAMDPNDGAQWQTLALAISSGIFGSEEKATVDAALSQKLISMVRLRISGITLVKYLQGKAIRQVSEQRPAVQYFNHARVDKLDTTLKAHVSGLATQAMAGDSFVVTGDIADRKGAATVFESSTTVMDAYMLGIASGDSRYQDTNEGVLFVETPSASDAINTDKTGWWMLVTVTIPVDKTQFVENVATEIVVEGDVVVLTTESTGS